MDDVEFDVLDELYFVVSFDDLLASLSLSEEELGGVLGRLAAKGWIRVYRAANEEIDDYDLATHFKSYFYLASKKGLLAHNQQ